MDKAAVWISGDFHHPEQGLKQGEPFEFIDMDHSHNNSTNNAEQKMEFQGHGLPQLDQPLVSTVCVVNQSLGE